MQRIKFSVSYQFEQSRLGAQIFWQVSKDFNIASWMEKFYQGTTTERKNPFAVDIIDIRQLKKSQQPKDSKKIIWDFLKQDHDEDTRIYDCLTLEQKQKLKNSTIKDTLASITKEKSIFRLPFQVYLYVLLWKQGLESLNECLNKQSEHILNTYDQLEVTFFLKTSESGFQPYFIIKERLFKSPVLNLKCIAREYIFDLLKSKFVEFDVYYQGLIKSLDGQELREKQIRGIQNGSTIQVLEISFQVDRRIEFVFGKAPISSQTKSIYYDTIDYNCSRNKFVYLKKNLLLREGKRFPNKHYSLAFQGGGAKGFAYVGAYKAIKQHKIDSQSIPIKSIMGSSAGGIVAIAASTGISWRQIEAVCYKMNTIPATDRIQYVPAGPGGAKGIENTDQYGNQISFQTFQNDLKELLKQFGILNDSVFGVLSNFFKGEDFRNQVQQKIVNFLKIMNPSISQILQIRQTQTVTPSKLKFWKSPYEVQRVFFNWSGLIFHGALMKGQAIHRIAAQCIIRYFFKCINESGSEDLSLRLEDAFRDNPLIMNQIGDGHPLIKSQKFQTGIIELKTSGEDLLKAKISDLLPERKDWLQFLVYLVNSTLFKLDILSTQSPQGKSVQIKKLKYDYLAPFFKFDEAIKLKEKQIENLAKIRQNRESNLEIIKAALANIKQEIKIQKKEVPAQIRLNISDERMNRRQQQFIGEDSEVKTEKIKIRDQLQRLLVDEQQFIDTITRLINSLHENNLLQQFKLQNLKLEIKQLLRQSQVLELAHTDRSPKLQNVKPFTKKMIGFLQRIKYLINCTTYSEINSVSNTTHLINYKLLALSEAIPNLTINDFIKSVFVSDGRSEQLVNQSQADLNKNITKLEIDKVVFDYFYNSKKPLGALTSSYNNAYDKLVLTCQTMTMKEYYALTGIELTCTSVDMDDHILRLFNHKTTPNLPVCRAIQMTGSFPVAFKAQRWRPEWGLYYVQKKGKIAALDITGHQFTDGGLLANFPIKYFDNSYISEQYFTHTPEQEKTIMLGFGLDMLEQGTYQLSPEEVQKANKVNIQKAKAIKQLQECIPKVGPGLSLFFNSGYFGLGQDQVKLGELNRLIPQKIPLFRFLSKLVRAYPNADRNLNIQAFENRVFMHDMADTNDSPTSQYLINGRTTDKQTIKKQHQQQKKWNLQNSFKDFKRFKNVLNIGNAPRPLQDNLGVLKTTIEGKVNALRSILQDRIKSIKKGHQIYYKNPIHQKYSIEDPVQQRQMSIYLLKILRTTLRNYTATNSIKINQQINVALSERFAFLKFIAEDKELLGQLREQFSLENELTVRPTLNEANLRNLYDSYNFDEISRHLNFRNVKEDYIKAAQKEGLTAKDIADPTKMTTDVRNRIFDVIKEKLKDQNNFFADPYQFYINQSLCRLTQYLFLQIKCKSPSYKKNIQKLVNIVKHSQFSELIWERSSSKFQYLTFEEISDFMQQLATKGVKYNNKLLKIQFQGHFLSYLQQIKRIPQNQKGKLPDHLLKKSHRMKVTLIKDLQSLIKVQAEKTKEEIEECLEEIMSIPQVITFSTGIIKANFQQKRSEIAKYLGQTNNDIIKQFLIFIVDGPSIKPDKNDLTVFNEGYIKIAQENSLQCLKQLSFGSNYEQLQYNNVYILKKLLEDLEKQLNKEKQNASKDINFDNVDQLIRNQRVSFAPIQKSVMQFFYNKTLAKYIQYRISNEQKNTNAEKKQSQSLKVFNDLYLRDVGYTLKFIKTLMLLSINKIDSKQYQSSQEQKRDEILLKETAAIYYEIFHNFNQRYQILSDSSENQFCLQTLNHAFLVKLRDISSLIRSIVQLKKFNCLEIDQTINNFINRNFSLPIFNSDISGLLKQSNFTYDSAIEGKINPNRQKRKPYLGKRTVKITKSFDSQIKECKQFNGDKSKDINLHLVLEGTGNASDYYSSFYKFIEKFMKRELEWDKEDKDKKEKMQLKQVTCSGFHSIFGFLLALGKDLEDIREDMLRIRQYAYTMFDGEKIKQFHSKEGTYRDTQNFASLNKSLTLELSTVFERFQTFISEKPQKFNYNKCFNDIRLLIEEQQRYYIESCNKILDESVLKIKQIETSFIDPVQPKQIAKAFAFDYKCGFNERHKYNQSLIEAKKGYFTIINQVFDQFGEVLSAVFCDVLASNSPLITQPDQIEYFTKGMLISRMLTVYKLKAFIYQQLNAHGLPRNITLNEFFQRSKPENQIVLNFLVVNVSEQRLEMLNKLQTPKMPLWAAILAASSLPIIHRNFWCEREWEQLQMSDKYHQLKRLEFFGNKASGLREKTFYNSSFYVSSLPIELLTNNTINQQIQTYDETFKATLSSLYFIGVAFNPKYSGNLSHLTVKRKYLKVTLSNATSVLGSLLGSGIDSGLGFVNPFKNYQSDHTKRHFNKSYEVQFGAMSALLSGLKSSSAMKTFGTLSEANDNFIMKWYYNRLIRLPIKFGTLDFGEIVDQHIYNQFKIQIPSSTAYETTLRSYHITKTFIHNIENRPSSNIQKCNTGQFKKSKDRYSVSIRASIIKVPNATSGYNKDYFSLLFINHSKWNRNIYNNFAIQYSIVSQKSLHQEFIRVDNSEITWEAEYSTKIRLRFYYISLKYDEHSGQNGENKEQISQFKYNSKATKIMFNQFILDFNQLNDHLPFRSSFDYGFDFAWDRQHEQLKSLEQGKNFDKSQSSLYLQSSISESSKQQIKKSNKTLKKIIPYKMNNVVISNADVLLQVPRLIISIVQGKEGEKENRPYLQRSNFRFLNQV